MTNKTKTTDITVRANGKCHPAVQFEDKYFMIVCACPGSKNGSLANRATKIAEGHQAANCGR